MQKIIDSIVKALDSNELLYLFIGVLFTLLLTAVGWAINSSYEHGKWIRNEKFKAYAQVSSVHFALIEAFSKILNVSYKINESNRARDELTKSVDSIASNVNITKTQEDKDRLSEKLKETKERNDILVSESEKISKEFELARDELNLRYDQLKDLMGVFSILTSTRMFGYITQLLNLGLPDIDSSDPEKFATELRKNQHAQSEIWSKLILTAKVELRIFTWFERIFANVFISSLNLRTWFRGRKGKSHHKA